jgi:tartrate-resistant acid phosphatase type 5
MRHGASFGLAFILGASLGCGGTGQTTETSGGSTGTGVTTGSTGASGSSGAGGNTSSSGSGSGSGSGGTSTSSGTGGGQNATVLRFVALGDGGEGNSTQYKVADTMQNICTQKGGCDFALYLGDNFYDSGVSGTGDSQFQSKFEMPYAVTTFRFYVVLGNHDYGGNGAGFEFWKSQAQVDYTALSQKWTMPDQYYKFSTPADAGPALGPKVDFFGLDTNAIMFTGDSDQKDWLDNGVAQSAADWKIGFGHHPYISNGQHGNAGEYEGIPFVPVVSGQAVEDFFDDAVCNKLDVYISGHDHNRQWLQPDCGVEFIVSGTAAKATDLVGQGTPTFFEKDQGGGFLLVEIQGNTLTGTFYDEGGAVEFTRTVTK